jgi:predicted transcriptional regulator of viral defense system
MRMNPLLKKLYLDTTEFITSDTLKKYCKNLDLDYDGTIKNLVFRGNLIRIFKGIFYIKNLEEIKLGRLKYSHMELIAKGLELKDVENWYFGLYSALKLNNMTHETFAIDHVLNNKIFRAKPIEIFGHKVKFHRISSKLLTFGITKKGKIRYSDPEKTVLDLLYLLRYEGVPENKIIMDISEYTNNISKEKMRRYVKYYPKTVEKTCRELL